MKTISEPSVISPTILILAALAGAILFVILKDTVGKPGTG
jgi:hypothetical protein